MNNKTQINLTSIEEIELEPITGSSYCQYSVIENKLAIIYRNQERILLVLKILSKKLGKLK